MMMTIAPPISSCLPRLPSPRSRAKPWLMKLPVSAAGGAGVLRAPVAVGLAGCGRAGVGATAAGIILVPVSCGSYPVAPSWSTASVPNRSLMALVSLVSRPCHSDWSRSSGACGAAGGRPTGARVGSTSGGTGAFPSVRPVRARPGPVRWRSARRRPRPTTGSPRCGRRRRPVTSSRCRSVRRGGPDRSAVSWQSAVSWRSASPGRSAAPVPSAGPVRSARRELQRGRGSRPRPRPRRRPGLP